MCFALLFTLVNCNNLTHRGDKMICLYDTGWADKGELLGRLSQPP